MENYCANSVVAVKQNLNEVGVGLTQRECLNLGLLLAALSELKLTLAQAIYTQADGLDAMLKCKESLNKVSQINMEQLVKDQIEIKKAAKAASDLGLAGLIIGALSTILMFVPGGQAASAGLGLVDACIMWQQSEVYKAQGNLLIEMAHCQYENTMTTNAADSLATMNRFISGKIAEEADSIGKISKLCNDVAYDKYESMCQLNKQMMAGRG
jgi:hypothetical protein